VLLGVKPAVADVFCATGVAVVADHGDEAQPESHSPARIIAMVVGSLDMVSYRYKAATVGRAVLNQFSPGEEGLDDSEKPPATQGENKPDCGSNG
jgi:hypothetical protein